MFQGLWPILQAVGSRYSASATVAENVCRVYKHALRTGGPGMVVVLPLLQQTLVDCYTSTPHSPYLYAGSICITEFASDPAHAPMLLHMAQAMAARTFALLTSLKEFTEHPDVVEEFFYLFERLMKHNPQALVSSNLLPQLTECGIVGLTVQHREGNRAVLNFFEKVTDLGIRGTIAGGNKRESPNLYETVIQQLFAAHGQKLVQSVVAGIAGQLPFSRIDDDSGGSLAGVLWYLADFSYDALKQWLTVSLQEFPDQIIPGEGKAKFIAELEHWSINRDHSQFVRTVRDFGAQCRYANRGNRRSNFHE
jgi:transportin-3